MKRAILFPGQGAQYVGMGRAFAEQFPEAAEIYRRADELIGFDLSRICFEGPAERLEATDVCQPAILVTSLAIVAVLEKRGGLKRSDLAAAAGLSLGEYSALCFAGALSLEDAVRLVRARGIAMQGASERVPSGMMTLVGAERATVLEVVAAGAESGVLVAANFLAPGQIAISGAMGALDAAEAIAKDKGVRRCVRLKVAGAFHSPLMQPAAEALQRELETVRWARPAIPVVSNVTGRPTDAPDEIRELLSRQVVSPVLWDDSMRSLDAAGVDIFLEPGPGKVLSGLARKSLPGKKAVSVDVPADVSAWAEALREASTGEEAGS